MKAKIITSEQAEERGLTKPRNAIVGRGITMTGDSKDDPGRIIEEQLIRENGTELIFMAEERKQSLKKGKDYSKYIKQFAKISAENVKQDIN